MLPFTCVFARAGKLLGGGMWLFKQQQVVGILWDPVTEETINNTSMCLYLAAGICGILIMAHTLWLRGRVVVLQPEGRQFDPQSSKSVLDVSLSNMQNPELCLLEQHSASNRCTVWCVCDWVNVNCTYTELCGHQYIEKRCKYHHKKLHLTIKLQEKCCPEWLWRWRCSVFTHWESTKIQNNPSKNTELHVHFLFWWIKC